MKLGGEYRLRNINLHHWRKLAKELRLDSEAIIHRVDDFAGRLRDHVPEIQQRMTVEGIAHPIIARLAEALRLRSDTCRKVLGLA